MTDEIPETGAVFTFGRCHFADNEPSHFFIKSDPVVAISCGDDHSAVICQNGRVFVFGGNAWGQLGLGHRESAPRPTCVKWLKPHRGVFVACGRAHTVFVTDTNAVYTAGCNDEGQLGTGDTESQAVPQPVRLEGGPHAVVQVAAGSNHTALLTDEGRVFVCGSNTDGQLGLGEDTKSSAVFVELKFMEKISYIECGYYHTVFITKDGAVFVTGENENQKLGIRREVPSIFVPEVLPLDLPMKSACCGAAHTFLLSMDESKILAFGSNEKGQLGFPKDVENVVEPSAINMEEMFEGHQLKLVACGAYHTAFVTENGLLYTCGESRHNKLCLDTTDTSSSNGVESNQYTPKRVTAMNGYIVDNVACGGCHTLLTATRGSNADSTNNDYHSSSEQNKEIKPELPPLQKVSNMNMKEEFVNKDIPKMDDDMNKEDKEDPGSIDSLEANVSGSHIVNINELDDSIVPNELDKLESEESNLMDAIKSMDNVIKDASEKMQSKMENTATNLIAETKTAIQNTKEKIEVVEDEIKKSVATHVPSLVKSESKILNIPDMSPETNNSPPPKSPVLQDLLHIPDISEMSPPQSKKSDEGIHSENETLPCDSDKSSPQMAKSKTQAVMPIVRSEDNIDSQGETDHVEDSDVVMNAGKGRFSRFFQSIKDKENSCMGKSKVIEEHIVENVNETIEQAEETAHKIEETVKTEIRNQTNSRTCVLL